MKLTQAVLLGLLLAVVLGCTKTPPTLDPTPPEREAPVKKSPAPDPEPSIANPATPQLLTEPEPQEEIHKKLARADEILDLLAQRTLDESQREHLEVGTSLVAQARQAFEEGDFSRASSVLDKALILIEELERGTREGREDRGDTSPI